MIDRGIVLALGFFETVHMGHVKVISECISTAKALNGKAVVLTFDDDFLKKLNVGEASVVFSLGERLKLYKGLGVDEVLVLPSDEKTLGMSVEDFHLFLGKFNIKALVCGTDFSYGKDAMGSVETLKSFGKSIGAQVKIVDFELKNGEKISSTWVKKLLFQGDMEGVRDLLGRCYFIDGKVVHGRGEGHLYNIPTANIEYPPSKILPGAGVYATKIDVDGKEYLSVTNVGLQPTFHSDKFCIESLLLHFVGDLYGKDVRLIFLEKLREIYFFPTKEQLVSQINKDIQRTEDKYGQQEN